jgi:hypothetical protein
MVYYPGRPSLEARLDRIKETQVDPNVIDINSHDSQPSKPVKKWLARIKKEQRVHEDFRDQASEAWAVYMDDQPGHKVYYPLFWGVAQIMIASCYSNKPVPDVRPRNSERNPQFKDAAQVMQRALEFYLDQGEFDENMGRTVTDYIVAGLGVPRIKLDANIVEVEDEDPETGEPVIVPIITDQMVRIEHVPWSRFGWECTANWNHVDWVYFEHHMTALEFKRRWPDATLPPTDDTCKQDEARHSNRSRDRNDNPLHIVYEIWDKRNREVLVIAKGNDEPLEVNEDPLGLQDFFPVPPPPMLNQATEEAIPTPDYAYLEPLDREIQRLYKRSRALTEQIKSFSLHDASLVEIEDLTQVNDGDSIPVSNMEARFGEGADLRKYILFAPIEERVAALAQVTQQMQLKRQHVDDLLGISDILRGGSNPQDGQETQKIKERWAGIRLRPKQLAVQRLVRDLFRMMAEVTVEHVTLDNLQRMTQIDITPEVYDLLQNDLVREFAIDIETESTVARDEFAERRERTELLGAINQYVQTVAPAVHQNIIPADLGREILQLATDPYKKYSRGLDDVLEGMETTQQQLQRANQAQQQSQMQIQQLSEQVQKLEYALNQFSQAEEARQDLKTEADAFAKQAKGTRDLAEVPDTKLQPDKTAAEIDKLGADTRLSEAKAVDTLRPDPPRPQNGTSP